MRRAERHPRGRLKSRVGETPLVSGWRKRSVMLPKGQTARYGVSSERFTWPNKLSGQTHALWRTIVQPQGVFLPLCSRRYFCVTPTLCVRFFASHVLTLALPPLFRSSFAVVLHLSRSRLVSRFHSRLPPSSCLPLPLSPRSCLDCALFVRSLASFAADCGSF